MVGERLPIEPIEATVTTLTVNDTLAGIARAAAELRALSLTHRGYDGVHGLPNAAALLGPKPESFPE